MGDIIDFPKNEPLSASKSQESHPQSSGQAGGECPSPSESDHADPNEIPQSDDLDHREKGLEIELEFACGGVCTPSFQVDT